MPLHDFYCDVCDATSEYYVPADTDALQKTANQAAAATDCRTCGKRSLVWAGLGNFTHVAPLTQGAYDKKGRFYRGNFGGGQSALPRKHVIRRY